MRDLKTPIAVLIFLIALLIGVYALSLLSGSLERGPLADDVIVDMFTPVPPSQEVLDMLAASRGFEVLVSYTNRGFEPTKVVIGVGESVRFTNNSNEELWVAANGSAALPVYPGVSDCGASELDTCKTLAPREFWEFTFQEPGTWMFKNNLDKDKSGSVRVEVRE